MPAQGSRPTRLFYLTACALVWIGAAAGQYAPADSELERLPAEHESPAAPQEVAPSATPDSARADVAPSADAAPSESAAVRADDAGLDVPSEPRSPVLDEPDPQTADSLPDLGADALIDEDDGALAADESGAPLGVGNEDVLAMTRAQFSEPTILAIIGANDTRFDISPRALVALKTAGVSETVINAMLSAETAKKQAAELSEPEPEPPAALPSEEFVKLSAMIERLAAQQEAAVAASRQPDPPKSSDASPRAWTLRGTEKAAVAPTIAQVAFTDEKGGDRLKTLQSLAGKALAFTNPAVSGIATTLGGLFRSDNEKRTAVWALAGTASSRELAPDTAFEIGFGHTPGVDPDAYQPAIVRLVRTNDNYRLVAAAKTEGSKTIATQNDPIVEELVPTSLTRIARGHYRVQAKEALGPGEYALVLRPIVQKERRRRKSEASLGELLGGGTSQVLYLTWDFSVAQ